jgi:hypothetical protein
MHRSVIRSTVLAASLVLAGSAHAQRAVRRPIELGIDGGVPFGRDDPRATRLTIAG